MNSQNNGLIVAMCKADMLLNKGDVKAAQETLRGALEKVLSKEELRHQEKVDWMLKEHAARMRLLEAMRDD